MTNPVPARNVTVSLQVNGRLVRRSTEARTHLVDFLRDELSLMDTHVSCEHGICGACTVRVDGDIVRGCLVLAAQLEGSSIETVEGLSTNGLIRQLQDAFVRHNALQCGFCTPGMLLCAAEFLERRPSADRAEIRKMISGNYCRCTGYHAIVSAISEVAESKIASSFAHQDGKPAS
jgi:aerobic-type carbon monoxide dehydrogenase small subunit (CoxS/CutS family)